jgi:hypothetical protein
VEIPLEARPSAAAHTGTEAAEADTPAASSGADQAGAAAEEPLFETHSALGDGGTEEVVERVPREEVTSAARTVPEEERAGDASAKAAEPVETLEEVEERQDRDTLVILLLILFQLALTLYLGRLSSWWSVTGILWLLVGYGVKERTTWALALPLVLFTLDIALLLVGIGPRERAGLPALVPLDFFLYLLRMGIWALIWRLRNELT